MEKKSFDIYPGLQKKSKKIETAHKFKKMLELTEK